MSNRPHHSVRAWSSLDIQKVALPSVNQSDRSQFLGHASKLTDSAQWIRAAHERIMIRSILNLMRAFRE
jgi:hypothetical protein